MLHGNYSKNKPTMEQGGTPQALYLAEKLLAIDGFYGRRIISS